MQGPHSLLEKFCNRLEEITGLRICIYDLGYFTLESERLHLPYLRRVHCSPYCELIKKDADANRKCIQTESWRIEKASLQASPFVHRCHAGVTDMVVPIRVGLRLVGAIFIGQCSPAGKVEGRRAVRQLAKKYPDLNGEAMERAIARLPALDEKRLRGMADLVNFVADYVKQALGSVLLETMEDVHIVHDSHGRIQMERVPNYFLDQFNPADGAMQRAIKLVRSSYWRDLTQSVVAAHVGLSESHFSRQFHRTFGMTFRRCMVEVRLSAAGWLVKKADLKIKEISDLVGYSDTSSLIRAMRIHSGVTPKSVRNRQPMPWHMNQPGLMPSIDALKANPADAAASDGANE